MSIPYFYAYSLFFHFLWSEIVTRPIQFRNLSLPYTFFIISNFIVLMKTKIILSFGFLLLLGFSASSQSNNTYDKQVVAASVTNLSAHTQSWIGSNFNSLNNAQVQSFMNQSFGLGLVKQYGPSFVSLKKHATEKEIELWYKSPNEEALKSLFKKYGISN